VESSKYFIMPYIHCLILVPKKLPFQLFLWAHHHLITFQDVRTGLPKYWNNTYTIPVTYVLAGLSSQKISHKTMIFSMLNTIYIYASQPCQLAVPINFFSPASLT
jgi:hypothetical protein